MSGTIEIFDLDETGTALVDLPEILEAIETEGRDLHWSVLALEATGNLDGLGASVSGLEAQVSMAPNGLALEWDALKQLANNLDQIIEGIIVGYREPETLKQIALRNDLPTICDIVMEAIDSSVWRIFSRDEEVLQKLRSTFHDVKTV